ncbi:hypothetical protein [Xanthomonas bundabergensis]|uniref:hypothetical protein n=1 Tax=Xanthomonas bundabergensis TaxID=3160842 RepID=UPI0035141ED6
MSRNVVLIGGTSSDSHVVSIYLAELFLKEHGYRVINNSCQNSVEELLGLDRDCDDLLAVVIVNQNGLALDDLRELRAYKALMPRRVPIILGGHYWIGCDRSDSYVDQVKECGVDHQLCAIDELAPLLRDIVEGNARRAACEDADLAVAFVPGM